jgi:hypothetical protein
VRFVDLPSAEVPALPGVYLVMRTDTAAPNFDASSPAGHFKGKDPSVTNAKLLAAWVPETSVVYIGKARAGATGRRSPRTRLDEYRRHGVGEPIGHWGGRYIWRLVDRPNCSLRGSPLGAGPGGCRERAHIGVRSGPRQVAVCQCEAW